MRRCSSVSVLHLLTFHVGYIGPECHASGLLSTSLTIDSTVRAHYVTKRDDESPVRRKRWQATASRERLIGQLGTAHIDRHDGVARRSAAAVPPSQCPYKCVSHDINLFGKRDQGSGIRPVPTSRHDEHYQQHLILIPFGSGSCNRQLPRAISRSYALTHDQHR